MALDAIIFDLDGTLVDSNAAHAQAWERAFESLRYRVAPELIFQEIGKGGDNFVPALLGHEADEKDGNALRKAQPEEFAKIARAKGLKVFPGAREILAELRRRGLKTALATSGGKAQLTLNEECSGLKVSELVDVVVNADDIKASKPYPDLPATAAKKLGLSVGQCTMIGDTPHDAEAGKRAGVACLGVTCGGHAPETLLAAGARAVWDDPADILTHLDAALSIASPGAVHLTQELLEELMHQALDVARAGLEADEAPIGAVLFRGDGTTVSSGYNRLNETQDKTAHAEMSAFRAAAGKVPTDARDLILVSTLEPCVMCLGAAMEAAVDTIVYALEAPADAGTRRVRPPSSPESAMPRIVGDVLRDESRKLFKEWSKKPGLNPQQKKFAEQLLSLT